MFLLLACAANPVDSKDTGVTHSDTADTGVTDTTDTTDTADTADTDTTDTTDTTTTDTDPADVRSTDDADLTLVARGYEQIGRSIEVGDADGDGADDLMFGALGMGGGAGGAWVVNGPVTAGGAVADLGVALVGSTTLGSYIGRTVTFDDMDGDGLADAILGSPYFDASVFVCNGPFPETRDLAAATTRIRTTEVGLLGHGLDVGDVDDNGTNDLVVGDYGASGAAINGGVVYLAPGPLPTGEVYIEDLAVARIFGLNPDEGFGRFVRTGGDVDGDGRDDLLIAQPWATYGPRGAGAVYLMLGGWTGDLLQTDADAILLGEKPGDTAGEELGFGDRDGDGHDEVMVGAFGAAGSDEEGSAYVLAPAMGEQSLGDAALIVRGSAKSARVGASLALDDADGDGRSDLLVGASGLGGGGGALLFWAPEAGTWTDADADTQFLGAARSGYAGEAVALHDIDGDGTIDVLLGAYQAEGGSGAIYAFTP